MTKPKIEEPAWLLLIYTVPSQPTRKRAAVWRDLKRLGAAYLRDGVAILPVRPGLEDRLQSVANRVVEYEGTADLIQVPHLRGQRDVEVQEQFRNERAEEYREVYHACVRFLRDVLEDVNADDFGFPDVEKLESELIRLRRYYDTIRERDYFAAPGINRVADILDKCDRAFERFVSTASERVEVRPQANTDDVYQRLAGPAAPSPQECDLPL